MSTTDSQSVSSTNEFPYAEGYAFDWNEDLTLNEPALRSPRPCKHALKCYYKNKETGRACGFVHPGEEGTGRKKFPGRSLTFKNKDGEDVTVEQGECVRLIGGAEYYLRLKAKMSWQEWQGMKNQAAQQAVHQAVRRVGGGGGHHHDDRRPRGGYAGAAAGGGGGRDDRPQRPYQHRQPHPATLVDHVEKAIAPAEAKKPVAAVLLKPSQAVGAASSKGKKAVGAKKDE